MARRKPDEERRNTTNVISGGVFFNAVIMGRDISVHLPPTIAPALAGPPAPSPAFAGREPEVHVLLGLLDPHGTDANAGVTAAVAGLAGVGKTELALQAAQAARKQGWFPGGVLFVDMHGYDPIRRVAPESALDSALRAIGIPVEHIPPDGEDKTRLYASLLATFAEQDQRILVILDNVDSAAQVRPLLPTDDGTRAVVTSRHTLASLDARLIELDVLTPVVSVDLLHRVLNLTKGPSDGRVQDFPNDAEAVAALCGHLPLALRIIAALLAAAPNYALSTMASDLADEHTRLDEMEFDDKAVRAAFDLSYRHLSPPQARMLRLLPVNVGPDISTETAAVLATVGARTARRLLNELARAHLVDRASAAGRWRLHDLVRIYADEQGRAQADGDKREDCIERLLTHYRTTAHAADDCWRLKDPAGRFSHSDEAWSWLEAERDNLVASMRAAGSGHSRTVRDLGLALVELLLRERSFHDLVAVSEATLAAARQTEDKYGEGASLNALGAALRELRQFDQAVDAHREAAVAFQEASHLQGLGTALSNLGGALHQRGRDEDTDAATRTLQQAIEVFREVGDGASESTALTNLGSALCRARRFSDAIDALQLAAEMCREMDDSSGESAAMSGLGNTFAKLGRFEEAITAYERDIAISRAIGDRHGQAGALTNLAQAFAQTGGMSDALHTLTEAVDIFRDIGDRHGEAGTLLAIANTWARFGRIGYAVEAYQAAAAIFRETNDRHGEAMALSNLGNALYAEERFTDAAEAHQQAADFFREAHDAESEGTALNGLGMALYGAGSIAESIDALTRSMEIFRELGDPDRVDIARTNLDIARRAQGTR